MKFKDGWLIEKEGKASLKDPILIEGLPGMGNVGKICADFLIDELKPTLIYDIYSYYFPHSVFVTETNLTELPKVSLYALKTKQQDFLILAGDIQPLDERGSYEFSTKILELISEFKCKKIITIGGIGLGNISTKPRVYGVASDTKTKKWYQKANKKIIFKEAKAATIVGAAGLLLGLGKLDGFTGIALLAETFGHPFHLGLKEARTVLSILKNIYGLEINLDLIEKEIQKEERSQKQRSESEDKVLLRKLKKMSKIEGDTSYIG